MPKQPSHLQPLSPKERRFVDEYIIDENATQAAIRAGYTRASARNMGARLMKKEYIQAAIKALMDEMRERNLDYRQRCIEEAARLAFIDPRRLFDAHGSPLPITEIPADVAAAIAGLEVDNKIDKDTGIGYGTRKIKLANKVESLRLLADLLGLLKNKVEHSGGIATYQLIDPYARPVGQEGDE